WAGEILGGSGHVRENAHCNRLLGMGRRHHGDKHTRGRKNQMYSFHLRSPQLLFAIRFHRDSPDESQTGVNIRAFPAFPQDSREVRTATGASGSPNGGRGLIWPFSLAFGRTPAVVVLNA